MIIFFRNIRQKFLAEGKTTKYLKYAIGEIVLVVIGILIALQVNNLNEQSKLNTIRKSKLQNIETDLRADVILLDSAIKTIEEESLKLQSLRKRLIAPNANQDTLYHIVNYEFRGWIRTNFKDFNKTTYISLVQSGDIGLLNEKLVKDLSNLNIQQEGTIKSLDDHWQVYLNKVQAFNARFVPKQNIVIINEGPIADYLRSSIEYKDLIIAFNEIYIAKNLLYRLTLSNLKNTLITNNQILNNHFIQND